MWTIKLIDISDYDIIAVYNKQTMTELIRCMNFELCYDTFNDIEFWCVDNYALLYLGGEDEYSLN